MASWYQKAVTESVSGALGQPHKIIWEKTNMPNAGLDLGAHILPKSVEVPEGGDVLTHLQSSNLPRKSFYKNAELIDRVVKAKMVEELLRRIKASETTVGAHARSKQFDAARFSSEIMKQIGPLVCDWDLGGRLFKIRFIYGEHRRLEDIDSMLRMKPKQFGITADYHAEKMLREMHAIVLGFIEEIHRDAVSEPNVRTSSYSQE